MRMFTIGYLGRTPADLLAIVEEHDGMLFDIRLSPKSRKPGFSEKRLRELFGDRYEWLYEFGNENYSGGPGGTIKLYDPDVGLEIIEDVRQDKEAPGAIFLMCACRDYNTCHRRIVGELLRGKGYEVEEWQ